MRCLVPSWSHPSVSQDQDETKFFFMKWDGTKSLWDESSWSHSDSMPEPEWNKVLVGWELPFWSHGQPICENQQICEDLSIRATTLASMTFQALISIITKFDLKTIQMNAVNTFMNCQLNKIIYMRQSLNFETENTVLQLRKTLYELRQSLLFWQKKLISTFRNLEFKKIL